MHMYIINPPRCGEPEENVTHAIFECPPALQVWSLSSTPTSQDIFHLPSIYANMDYLFLRKNDIVEPELDRDPYPWMTGSFDIFGRRGMINCLGESTEIP